MTRKRSVGWGVTKKVGRGVVKRWSIGGGQKRFIWRKGAIKSHY